MDPATKIENDYPTKVNQSLTRLQLAGYLEIRCLWEPTNYDKAKAILSINKEDNKLTFPSLIEQNDDYVTEICEGTFAGQEYLVQEEFLASFLERMLTRNPEKQYQLAQDIDNLPEQEGTEFYHNIAAISVQRQIPFQDTLTLLGVYVLHQAQEQGLVQMGQNVGDEVCCVVYHPKDSNLEKRV
ncbi:hypothetical protein HOE37_04970 [Candidatus Woesearchaeota archaeon]|jgi:hypothetical protein|nr:hypothetical protein [Candidatus Woesearchaeota archaeon]MBT4111184.1 hypothetical protein [Candidatus Woesearchaeota archaeon]MBT4336764.1 hypothetical protein [Candidatus Woesearchaeota archaeon]MBT4469432.1 hypothetical protein [Candidatus Woesearchaeota archaeon]MBT6744173.1 hypothetical protein [Candidatus Woesearchaeota archaeon]